MFSEPFVFIYNLSLSLHQLKPLFFIVVLLKLKPLTYLVVFHVYKEIRVRVDLIF